MCALTNAKQISLEAVTNEYATRDELWCPLANVYTSSRQRIDRGHSCSTVLPCQSLYAGLLLTNCNNSCMQHYVLLYLGQTQFSAGGESAETSRERQRDPST